MAFSIRATGAACAASLLFALAGCGNTAGSGAVRTLEVMSTVATISAKGADEDEAAEAAAERLRSFEETSSRFISGSDISRVNESAGVCREEISEDSYIMLTRAVDYAAETSGSFDVTIGALSSLWGIGSGDPRVPSESEIADALALVDIGDLALSSEGGRYYAMLAREGEQLDLGGCAKGYALDLCRDELKKYRLDYAFVSLGGNVMLLGDKNGEGFKVGVRYPEQGSSGSLCVLRLADTCVATTGAYERYFEQDGVRYHHVLDPATGYPAQTDILSASVVCADGMRGDYLSTRLFMLGVEGALELMRSGGAEAVIVAENGTVYISSSLESAFIKDKADAAYTFEFV